MGAAAAGVDQQAEDSVRHGIQDGPDDRQRPEARPVVRLGESQLEGDSPRMHGLLPVDDEVGLCRFHESVTVGVPPPQGRQFPVQHLDGPVLHAKKSALDARARSTTAFPDRTQILPANSP
jgi:hypothetical protein